MSEAPEASTRRPFAVAALALLLYLALGQNLMHGFDAFYYLRDVDQGELHHPRFAFYLPVAWVWAKALGVLDVPLYEAVRALSAFAAALGVLCTQFAARRLGFSPRAELMTGLAVASLPAVVYTASVVEVDAVFFACSAACWLPFARVLTDNRIGAAIATGVATAVAAGFHASGHLLALQLAGLAMLWDWPQRRLARGAVLAGVQLAVHLVLAIAIAMVFGIGEQGEMATNTVGHAFPLDFVPYVALREWILPYAPVGVLALLALKDRNRIGAGLAYAIVLCGYVFVSTKILGYQRYAEGFLSQGNATERGSFLLALAVPMVLLLVRAAPPRLAVAAIAVGLYSSVWQVREYDWPDDPPAVSPAIDRALEKGPIAPFVADNEDWAWIARRHPRIRATLFGEVVTSLIAARAKNPDVVTPEIVLLWFAMEYDRAVQQGAQYVVTQHALDAMAKAEESAIRIAAERLRDAYTFTPLDETGGYAAFVLTRK